jgi:two-component system, NtrC family, response regulator HydG
MSGDDPAGEAPTGLGRRYDPDAEAATSFTVTVVDGPDRGQRIALEAALLVGQSPTCALRLTDRLVSRRHLSLEPSGARVRVADLGSTNGTFVEGVAITDAWVRGGEVIRLGASALSLQAAATAAPAPPVGRATRFGKLLGSSLEMRRLHPLAARLAQATLPVLVEGETGTGKEVLAEALHEASPRAGGPWVVFDCTAVPPSLIESELFGHERGAFTGAVAARKGLFERAHGGTLLIDEIGDLALPLQAKLLRAIERGEVRRVGSDEAVKVDVRIVAATRRNLDHEVQEGRFRDDLFHRLVVGRIELPPLRRRRGDVAVLARHFWTELGGSARTLSSELVARWEDYSWPGNVRELRNAVARQLALGDARPGARGTGAVEEPPAASQIVSEVLDMRLPLPMARLRLVEAFEQLYIEQVLREHDGNVARAAEAAGVAKRYFQLLRSRRS